MILEDFKVWPSRRSKYWARVIVFNNLKSMRSWTQSNNHARLKSERYIGYCIKHYRSGLKFATICLIASYQDGGKDPEFLETAIHESIHAAYQYIWLLDARMKRKNLSLADYEETICRAADWMAGRIIRKFMLRMRCGH